MDVEVELAVRPHRANLFEPRLNAELVDGCTEDAVDESTVNVEVERSQIADEVSAVWVELETNRVEYLTPMVYLEKVQRKNHSREPWLCYCVRCMFPDYLFTLNQGFIRNFVRGGRAYLPNFAVYSKTVKFLVIIMAEFDDLNQCHPQTSLLSLIPLL